MNRTFALRTAGSLALTSLLFAAQARAATIQRLAPAGSLGRIEFKHMKANASGDFVGITNMKIFVGNLEGVAEIPVNNDRIGFSLDDSVTVNPTTGGTDPNSQVIVDAELFNTRVDINADGDFVVASNTLLFVGNTRSKTLRQVADGGSFTQFQAVKLNDGGQYVAISDRQIFAGKLADPAATKLLADADSVGNFSIFDVSNGFSRRVDVTAGEQRLQLNERGQFLAITGSAVYGGQVGDAAAAKIYEERYLGFRHAALTAAGTFVIVAGSDVFAGSL